MYLGFCCFCESCASLGTLGGQTSIRLDSNLYVCVLWILLPCFVHSLRVHVLHSLSLLLYSAFNCKFIPTCSQRNCIDNSVFHYPIAESYDDIFIPPPRTSDFLGVLTSYMYSGVGTMQHLHYSTLASLRAVLDQSCVSQRSQLWPPACVMEV